MAIQESGEMYLETIHILQKKNGQVRAIDISEHIYCGTKVQKSIEADIDLNAF